MRTSAAALIILVSMGASVGAFQMTRPTSSTRVVDLQMAKGDKYYSACTPMGDNKSSWKDSYTYSPAPGREYFGAANDPTERATPVERTQDSSKMTVYAPQGAAGRTSAGRFSYSPATPVGDNKAANAAPTREYYGTVNDGSCPPVGLPAPYTSPFSANPAQPAQPAAAGPAAPAFSYLSSAESAEQEPEPELVAAAASEPPPAQPAFSYMQSSSEPAAVEQPPVANVGNMNSVNGATAGRFSYSPRRPVGDNGGGSFN